MLFITLVLSSTSGENYWKKIFLWAHLLSSKMARLLSSSPIMFYVSPLQLSAKHLVSLLKLFESRRHFLRCPHTELPWSELKTFS